MRSIWAVAINTIKQALRLRVAIVFMVLLIVLLPVLGVSATGDGTLKGRLQTFVSYGLSLMSFLLCLLTVIVSIYAVTSDIEQRQIYTVITKPIRRYQLLLGKLLGVIMLDVVLLCVASAIIYTTAVYMPKFFNSTEAELAQAKNEFFTARTSRTPAEVDVSREVIDRYTELERSGQLPADASRDEIIAELTKQRQLAKRAAAVGGELIWEFENVRPRDPNGSLFIRFKYDVPVSPPDLQVYSEWFAGDYRQIKYGTKVGTPIHFFRRQDSVRTFCEIEVPANAVAKDGYLAVGFHNVPNLNQTYVIFPPDSGLEVLYKADTFTGNFIRAILLLLFRLIFLACLGISASTFLSFPVAMLLCLVLFFTASFSGFVIESCDYLSENMTLIYSYTIKWMIRLLPQFDRFNPTKLLISARLLSWSLLAECAAYMVCLKAFILLAVALVIFSFREIARIVV